ncbi:unnamed protein product, partial [Iphiclides podalirius]
MQDALQTFVPRYPSIGRFSTYGLRLRTYATSYGSGLGIRATSAAYGCGLQLRPTAAAYGSTACTDTVMKKSVPLKPTQTELNSLCSSHRARNRESHWKLFERNPRE